jgi:hypothetical protein
LEWQLAEFLVAMKEQEERTLAGLDQWRDENAA